MISKNNREKIVFVGIYIIAGLLLPGVFCPESILRINEKLCCTSKYILVKYISHRLKFYKKREGE